MQRSQLLSDKNIQPSSHKGHAITIDNSGLNLMKRSCISAMDGTPRATNLSIKSSLNGSTPPQNPNNGYSFHNSSNYYSNEARTPEPYQLHQHNPSNLANMRHSHSMVQNNENEYHLPVRNGQGSAEQSGNYENWISPKEQLRISSQIIEIIREKHLENWLKPVRQELQEEVSKVRGELQSLRAEWNL